MAKSYIIRSRGNAKGRRGPFRNGGGTSNGGRRYAGSSNLNISSSRTGGGLKPGASPGFGGRRINTSFGSLNKRNYSNRSSTSFLSRSYKDRRNNGDKGGLSVSRGGRNRASGVSNAGGFRRRGGSFNPKSRNGNRRYQKSRTSSKQTTVASLDAALDTYMGSEVCKARLDSQLDAYFSGQNAGEGEGVAVSRGDLAMSMDANQESAMI